MFHVVLVEHRNHFGPAIEKLKYFFRVNLRNRQPIIFKVKRNRR